MKIHFIDVDGNRTSVDGEAGLSVMAVAIANGVQGIVGECGGAAMCATCHVYLDPEFAEKVPPVGELEADMLECAAAPTTQFSRLSCQIVLKPELEDLVVHLPASQY